jgi:hypothetical protein
MDVRALSPMRAPDASVPPFTDPDWLYEIKFDGYRTLPYALRPMRNRDWLKEKRRGAVQQNDSNARRSAVP